MAKLKTLQNPWAEGLGNDYEQDISYVVEFVDKDGNKATKETGKSTWRDGIYTKLAKDVKDPDGYNKRTVMVPQSAWGTVNSIETIGMSADSGLSGETDASALFTSGAYAGYSFGQPFDTKESWPKFTENFKGATYADYFEAPSGDKEKVPQGFEVASFRQVEH